MLNIDPVTVGTSLYTLYTSRRAIAALFGCGSKAALHLSTSALGLDEAPEILEDLAEIIGGISGNLVSSQIEAHLQELPADQLSLSNQHLVKFTGLVLQALVEGALEDETFTRHRHALSDGLHSLPDQWSLFVESGVQEAQPLSTQDFVQSLGHALRGESGVPAVDPTYLQTFFAIWLRRSVSETYVTNGLHRTLADTIGPRIGAGLIASLPDEHPIAQAAFKEALISYHTEIERFSITAQRHDNWVKTKLDGMDAKLTGLRHRTASIKADTSSLLHGQAQASTLAVKHHDESIDIQERILRLLAENTAPARLRAYFYELQLACQDTRELDDSDDGSGDRKAPDIWDAFVPPGCRSVETSSEQIEAAHGCADLLSPPIADILPLLASNDHRRVVLLGDPGTGKSTLIQFIAAVIGGQKHLHLLGEPLRQCIPLPFILRQLAMHLGNDLATWTWETLEHLFFTEADLRENRSKLCRHFTGHEDEWRTQIIGSDRAWFLIDGLDEIGDVAKRRALCAAVHQGMKKYPRARWLITSRIVGYEEAPIDVVNFTTTRGKYQKNPDGSVTVLSAPAVVTGGSAVHVKSVVDEPAESPAQPLILQRTPEGFKAQCHSVFSSYRKYLLLGLVLMDFRCC